MLETKFNSNELWYGQREEWTLTDLQYGVYTTSDTPAAGYISAGSHIPGGRFLAAHPDNVSSTSNKIQQAILPDLLGTSLVQNDGTDYSAIIAGALDGAGDFIFVGVSPVNNCKKDICMRAQINHDNKRNGFNEQVIPDTLIGAQPKPIGYSWTESIDNYTNYRDAVSAINSDRITVYAEQDINLGDTLFIRVQVLLAGAPIDQLLGGVTNVADAGTQDPSKYFNIRVTKAAKAGSAVEIQLS